MDTGQAGSKSTVRENDCFGFEGFIRCELSIRVYSQSVFIHKLMLNNDCRLKRKLMRKESKLQRSPSNSNPRKRKTELKHELLGPKCIVLCSKENH